MTNSLAMQKELIAMALSMMNTILQEKKPVRANLNR